MKYCQNDFDIIYNECDIDYIDNLIEYFEDKKNEIYKNILELLNLLYYTNKKIDNLDTVLPVLQNYEDDEGYFDMLFTYIISIKEENAKLIENINNL